MSLHAYWRLLREPRAVTAVSGGAWLIVVAVGISALLSPPPTLSHAWGSTITWVWAMPLIMGGLISVAGCLPGWWWVERVGILATGTGVMMYLSIVVILHVCGPNSQLVSAGHIIVILAGLTTRWLQISGLALDPAKGRDVRS